MRGYAYDCCENAPCPTTGEGELRRSKSDVENAVIGHGKIEGPYTEIDNMAIERDPRFPIRVTVQFYKATSNGVVSEKDLAGPVGTPILATGDGTVKFAGRQSGYGNVIIIEHALGTETRYGHLSKIRVQAGQKVSRGSQIGDMGNTGRSTGPHLHYEVRVNGNAVNPMSFIKAAQNVF